MYGIIIIPLLDLLRIDAQSVSQKKLHNKLHIGGHYGSGCDVGKCVDGAGGYKGNWGHNSAEVVDEDGKNKQVTGLAAKGHRSSLATQERYGR